MRKPLPKVQKPLFELPFPSQNKTVKARRFVVREEKLLLLAGESGEEKDIILAVKQVINNCVIDKSFNVDDLTLFDLEYMFIKLRARSVNNIVEVVYTDLEDNKEYKFSIDLDQVELKQNSEIKTRIEMDENTGFIMKYPSVNIIESMPDDLSGPAIVEYLIRSCIDQIYDAEDVYFAKEYTTDELNEFIDELEPETFEKVRDFFNNLPHLYYRIDYKNSKGTPRKIELTSLNDFFTWG